MFDDVFDWCEERLVEAGYVLDGAGKTAFIWEPNISYEEIKSDVFVQYHLGTGEMANDLDYKLITDTWDFTFTLQLGVLFNLNTQNPNKFLMAKRMEILDVLLPRIKGMVQPEQLAENQDLDLPALVQTVSLQ